MKSIRAIVFGAVLMGLVSVSFAQEAASTQPVTKHVLSGDELQKAVPTEFFYRGQKAPVQLRNSGGFQLADGKMMLAALVDSSGYSTSIQQKYQGLLITEARIKIAGAWLEAGEYGFGFTDRGRFVVMNVANEDVLTVPFDTEVDLKRPVPLKIVESGGGYKLYSGRKSVTINLE